MTNGREPASPLIALMSAVAGRQAAAMPPVTVPGGRLDITGVQMTSEGLVVQMSGTGRLGLATSGSVHVRVASVAADHALLAPHAEGGLAFRAAVNTAIAAGSLLEPLLRALLGRPLRQGIEMHRGLVRITYSDLLDAFEAEAAKAATRR